jgi:hypothetical protein
MYAVVTTKKKVWYAVYIVVCFYGKYYCMSIVGGRLEYTDLYRTVLVPTVYILDVIIDVRTSYK